MHQVTNILKGYYWWGEIKIVTGSKKDELRRDVMKEFSGLIPKSHFHVKVNDKETQKRF